MRSLFILAAAVLLAVPLRAQDASVDSVAPPPNGLQKGAWSLSFVAPGYSANETAEFGVWEMVGPRTNLGVTLEVLVGGREQETDSGESTAASTSVGLGFNVRQYLASARHVAPYVQGRLFGRGSYQRYESTSADDSNRGAYAGVEAALGAEWFPVRQFSLSGHTGVRLSASRFRQELTTPTGEQREASSNEGQFQTFTSALAVRIYF